MQSRDILERLGSVIAESAAEEVDWSIVTADTTVEAFGFDSLSVLDLIFDLDQVKDDIQRGLVFGRVETCLS